MGRGRGIVGGERDIVVGLGAVRPGGGHDNGPPSGSGHLGKGMCRKALSVVAESDASKGFGYPEDQRVGHQSNDGEEVAG